MKLRKHKHRISRRKVRLSEIVTKVVRMRLPELIASVRAHNSLYRLLTGMR